MKKVIDVYGRECFVDETNQKLLSFDNKLKKVRWSAEVFRNGELSESWTDYIEEGTIDDFELRFEAMDNPFCFEYAIIVNFHASRNDPNKEIWNALKEYAYKNQDLVFDKYGNFKKSSKRYFQEALGENRGADAYNLAFSPTFSSTKKTGSK